MPSAAETFRRYFSPESPKLTLPCPPRLASWDRADHPSQRNLAEFLDAFEAAVGQADWIEGPLAIQLNVALEPGVPLLVHRDLDNYLTPIMTRMRQREVVSVWGTKARGEVSTIQVESARQATDEATGWAFARARASGSATSVAWKHSIYDQISEQATEAATGPLEMQVSFRVGAARAWINLWKQSIDSLGPILGLEDPRNQFHPLDGRIVRLGLHHTLATEMGLDVDIGVWWRAAAGALDDPGPVSRKPVAPRSAPRPAPTSPGRRPEAEGELVEFRNNDEGYVAWIQAHRDGFVVNTTPGHSRSYLKLHRASCKFVSVLQSGYSTWTSGEYVKVCSTDRAVLERWARDEVGGELQDRCYCRP